MFVYPLTRSAHVAVQRAASAHPFNVAVERLFDESADRVFGRARPDAVRTPAIDVAETDTTYRVALEMPGAVREQLKVTIEGRRLNVETAAQATPAAAVETADADKKDGAEQPVVAAKADAERVLYRERVAAKFARTIVLPAEVDQAGSEAKFENGVLTLTLVKKVPTGARQISIS